MHFYQNHYDFTFQYTIYLIRSISKKSKNALLDGARWKQGRNKGSTFPFLFFWSIMIYWRLGRAQKGRKWLSALQAKSQKSSCSLQLLQFLNLIDRPIPFGWKASLLLFPHHATHTSQSHLYLRKPIFTPHID